MADRVLHILEAAVGGALKHVVELIGELPEEFTSGLAYSPLRSAQGREAASFLAERGISVYPVGMRRRPAPLGDAAAALRLAGIIRREGYGLIHAHSAKAGLVGRAAALLAGVPAVYTPHCFPFVMQVPRWQSLLYESWERWASRATAAIIVLSAGEEAAARRAGLDARTKLYLIPNGVSPAASLPERSALRRRLSLEGDAFTVGVVGRLCRQKGTHLLPDIIKGSVARVPGIRFVIVGEGEMEGWLQAQVAAPELAGHLIMTGYRADAALLYPAFDMLLLPSLWEAAPYTLLEAMSAGVPVAAAAADGCCDAILPGETGLLFPPGDAGAAAAAILEMAASAELCERLGRGGKVMAEENYSRARSVALTAGVYRQVIEEVRKGRAASRP